MKDLAYAITCGGCPTQAEGTVGGWPLYFRYRYGIWRFSIPALPDGDPVGDGIDDPLDGAFTLQGRGHESGWHGIMHLADVDWLIRACVAAWRAVRGVPALEHDRMGRYMANMQQVARAHTFVQDGSTLHVYSAPRCVLCGGLRGDDPIACDSCAMLRLRLIDWECNLTATQ